MDDDPNPAWAFMMAYQREHQVSPTLREMAEHLSTLNYRSSAREVIVALMRDKLVVATKPAGFARRYEAVYAREACE